MAANTARLKSFAQSNRAKLVSLISARLDHLLTHDSAEIRGWAPQIKQIRTAIAEKGKVEVIEEVAYTWFNRIMALRYMDANGFNAPMVVSIAEGQTRPQILEEGMAGSFEDDLNLKEEDRLLTGPALYRKLLVAKCNSLNAQMPFLFEHISDYTEMLLPDDLLSPQSFVTDIRNGMTDEDCENVEVVGWLYQFYITDRKADAEKNKSRRGGLRSDEQAAATQLFTPHWIVRYMVENSLGRIWMTLHPESSLVSEMPYYLAPVDGQKDQIPEDIKSVTDIRFLDPCMGSGHVLVYAFDLLTKMYEEEGYPKKEIPTMIFKNNLFGMDIDQRCYQLASFALTMKARDYYPRFLRMPVEPQVIALQPIDRDTIESAGAWSKDSLVWQMENLDTIGSLLKITPEEAGAIKVNDGMFGEELRLMKKQAEYLSGSYHCVVTNPPYLGKGQSEVLKNYLAKQFPGSKADTYAAFIERLTVMPCKKGYCAMVTMESWMFLSSFESLRKKLLEETTIQSLSHFDWHIMHIAFGTVAFILQNKAFEGEKGIYSYLNRRDVDLDIDKPYSFPLRNNGRYAVKSQNTFEKIPGCPIAYWASHGILDAFYNGTMLEEIAYPRQGMATCNNGRFLRLWFEVNLKKIGLNLVEESQTFSEYKWFPYNKGGGNRKWAGYYDFVVNFQNGGKEVCDYIDSNSVVNHKGRVINRDKYFKPSVTWSKISSSEGVGFRYREQGSIFDVAGTSIFAEEAQLQYLVALLNSKPIPLSLACLSPTINFEVGHICSIPVIYKEDMVIQVIDNAHHCIFISKQDWDSHETSWDFQGSPLLIAQRDCNKNVADLDMLDEEEQNEIMKDVPDIYNGALISNCVNVYKSKWSRLFHQLHRNEEELNRKFIEIYGLEDELTPDVPLDEVTILQKGEISVEDGEVVWHEDVIIKQFISYLVGCFMGRYSVDRPGLMIANQGQKPEDLDLPESIIEIDDDGIIPVIQEEDFFADDMTARVEEAVEILFGKENKTENLRYIKQALGMGLRDYFFKEYYKDHLAMYSVKGAKRPIYWLFSSKMGDKKKKGVFKALIYMHRMEGDTLSKLHADYVHPYIGKLERQFREVEEELTREDLPAKKRNELLKLSETLRGNISEVKDFEAELVKMASSRPTFDLDDGVANNYPKFYPLTEPIKGLEAKDD